MITIPYVTALATYFSYGLLLVFGQIRDLFRNITDGFSSNNLQARLRLILFYQLLFLFSFLLYLCVCVRVLVGHSLCHWNAFCESGLRSNLLRKRGFLSTQVISTNSGISVSYLTSYMPSFAYFFRLLYIRLGYS